jgi:hypothetical protein
MVKNEITARFNIYRTIRQFPPAYYHPEPRGSYNPDCGIQPASCEESRKNPNVIRNMARNDCIIHPMPRQKNVKKFTTQIIAVTFTIDPNYCQNTSLMLS